MKVFFIAVILMHGIIHLIGFLKAFEIAEISQLTEDISKPIGSLWLLVTLLFLLVIILVILNQDWWWLPAIIATVISQYLIILSWQDAKFGTILNIIILIAIVIGFAVWQINTQTNKKIDLLLTKTKSEEVIVTNEMLEDLPSSVKQWLSKSGMVGKNKIQTVYFKQKGLMKLNPDQKKWSTAQAEQYVTTDKPEFIWKVNMKMSPFINVYGRDHFTEGEAEMLIKVAALIPVVNVSNNKKANESTMQRYLMELPLYPSAALSSYLEWEEIDEQTAKVTMTYQEVTVSAVYHFTHDGDFEKVSAFRYKDVDKSGKLIEYIAEVEEYTVIDGIKIPTKLNMSWMLDEGKFTWYKLEIYDVKYN